MLRTIIFLVAVSIWFAVGLRLGYQYAVSNQQETQLDYVKIIEEVAIDLYHDFDQCRYEKEYWIEKLDKCERMLLK